jgi:hypothetical protein
MPPRMLGMARRGLITIRHRNNTESRSGAKIGIRRNVLDAIGADNAAVFDGFAGEGAMYRAVWSRARFCVGCDLDFRPEDDRLAYAADNRRVLRALDLARFNIFDCDAWGDPWEQMLIIATRRQMSEGETIGLVWTDGQAMKMQFQHRPGRALQVLAGVENRVPGMHRELDAVHDRAIARIAGMMGAAVARQWRAMAPNRSMMRYGGVVLRHE